MKANRGFTLIELVVVIVVIAVLAVMVSEFFGTGVTLYRDNSEQQRVLSDVRFAMERLNREIGTAHPFSLRDPMGNGLCIEFIPVTAAGHYQGSVQGSSTPVVLEVAGSDSDFLNPALGSAIISGGRLSINTLTTSELYALPSSVSGSVASMGTVQISGALRTVTPNPATFVWRAESAARRYLVLNRSGPVAWCINNSRLIRYSNYGWLSSWGGSYPVTSSAVLMASSLGTGSRFALVTGNINHNQLVDAGMQLQLDGGGTLILNRRMQVNYVP